MSAWSATGSQLPSWSVLKSAMLSDLKKQYDNREKTKSRSLIWAYLSNFMTDEPVPGIAYEYDYAKKALPGISLEEVNALAEEWVTDENLVVAINAVKKEGTPLPTEQEVLDVVKAAKNATLEKYEDDVSDMPLITELPEPGIVTEEKHDEELGTTTYLLENGLKITVKPTGFQR
ncbi:MAG: hypothetical protein U5L09_00725 [Bacteroidales bacterium]|nr:hypothetical protein [Bacteroidales bacterium]